MRSGIAELRLVEQREVRADHEVDRVAGLAVRHHAQHALEQQIGLRAQRRRLGQQLVAHRPQRAAGDALAQRRGHAIELRLVAAARLLEHAPEDAPALGHQHRQHALARDAHEAHVAQHHAVEPRRHHEAELPGALGEQPRRRLHDAVAAQVILEVALLEGAELARREQLVDEDAQPELAGDAPGRAVRLLEQAELVELAERVAHAR